MHPSSPKSVTLVSDSVPLVLQREAMSSEPTAIDGIDAAAKTRLEKLHQFLGAAEGRPNERKNEFLIANSE